MLDIYKRKIFTKLILFNIVFYTPYQVHTMEVIIPLALGFGLIFGGLKAKNAIEQNENNKKMQQVKNRKETSRNFEELENSMYKERINMISHERNYLSLEKIYELFKDLHSYIIPKNKKNIALEFVKKDHQDDEISTDDEEDEDNYRETSIRQIEKEQKQLTEEQQRIYQKQKKILIQQKKETINMYFAEIIEYRNKIIKISKTTNAKSYKTQVLSSIEKEKNKVNHHTRILTMTYVKEALKFLDMPHKTFYIRSKGKSEKIATILKNMKNKTMNKSDIEYLCKYLNLLQYEECQELIQYLPEIFIIYGKNFTFFNGLFKEKYQVQLIIPLYKHIYYYNFIVEFHNICKVSLDFLSENLKGEILAFNQTLQMLQEEQEITSLHAERDHNIRLLCQLYILNTQEYSLLEGGISKINNLSQEEREEMIIEMLSNICKVFEIFEKTPSKLPSILHEFIYSFYTICALTFLLGTNISNLHYH